MLFHPKKIVNLWSFHGEKFASVNLSQPWCCLFKIPKPNQTVLTLLFDILDIIWTRRNGGRNIYLSIYSGTVCQFLSVVWLMPLSTEFRMLFLQRFARTKQGYAILRNKYQTWKHVLTFSNKNVLYTKSLW